MAPAAKIEILLVGVRHEFQYTPSANPSLIEQNQRQAFLKRVTEIIEEFKPTIIADENERTNNEELLALFPSPPIFIDIPHQERITKNLQVHRPNAGLALCPCVDSIRERHWKQKIDEAAQGKAGSRILVFVGSLHLQRFPSKPESFADLLKADGYSVSSLDLWGESWAEGDWKWTPQNDHRPQLCPRPCYLAMGYETCPDLHDLRP